MRKNILKTVEADGHFLLCRVIVTLVCQVECAVKMNFGGNNPRVFPAARTVVEMPVKVSYLARTAGDSMLGFIVGMSIVGFADIDIIAFYRDSAGLGFGETKR